MDLNIKTIRMISQAVKFYLASLKKYQMESVVTSMIYRPADNPQERASLELEIEEYTKLNSELDVCLQYKEHPLND